MIEKYIAFRYYTEIGGTILGLIVLAIWLVLILWLKKS